MNRDIMPGTIRIQKRNPGNLFYTGSKTIQKYQATKEVDKREEIRNLNQTNTPKNGTALKKNLPIPAGD
jgi:hypothetical protein